MKMSLKRVEELRGTRTLEPGQENAATQENAAYSEKAVINEGSEVNNDCFHKKNKKLLVLNTSNFQDNNQQ